MSETTFDNIVIMAVMGLVAWLIGRYAPSERYDFPSSSGPDAAEDWSDVYPPRNNPPSVAFKTLAVGQQFRIPNSPNPELIFEKIRITDDGDNARSDIYARWIAPEMHVELIVTPAWRTS